MDFYLPFDYEKFFGGLCIPLVVSYNNLNKNEIIEIIHDYVNEIKLNESEKSVMTDEQYNKLKRILRKKKIIMIKTFYYN